MFIFRGYLGFEFMRYGTCVFSYRKGLELVLEPTSWYIADMISKGLIKKSDPFVWKVLDMDWDHPPKNDVYLYDLHELTPVYVLCPFTRKVVDEYVYPCLGAQHGPTGGSTKIH